MRGKFSDRRLFQNVSTITEAQKLFYFNDNEY